MWPVDVVLDSGLRAMKVSILIPCYNARRWIGGAIRSALEQTYGDTEVIVVDDGSTDGSAGVIDSFGNAIRSESTPNRGGNAARNRLLELANGTWLQYLDADDYLLPDKVARQMDVIQSTPAVDVLYSPVTYEHWEDEEPVQRRTAMIDESRDPWVLLARWLLPQTGAPLWRKSALLDVGGWKVDQPCCQEHELYLRLLQAGKQFVYAPVCGAVYRKWSTRTVCRRDPRQTLQRRLEVVRKVEEYLLAQNALNDQRRDAIAHARLESARTAYHLDRAYALSLIGECRLRHPTYRLPAAPSFPGLYRMAYRWLGFRGAEWLASTVRPVRSALGRL